MSENVMWVAVDDGYAQTKVVGEREDGTLTKFVMRSSARAGRFGLGNISGGGGGIGCYETEEGEIFTVSEEIEAESTRFDGYHVSPMNRVMVTHALASAGYGGKEIHLITGLPVADFFLNAFRDDEKIEAKRGNLLKGLRNAAAESPLPVVKEVKVGCQAVAAWVDYVLDDKLEERNDPSAPIAVVDVGGRTTDVAVVVGGQSIDHSRSGTENLGVLDVYQMVGHKLNTEFKIRDKFPLALLDRAVRTGKMRLFGKETDVTEFVRAAVEEQQARIAREVERRIGSAATLDAVVFVGGGGSLFHSIAEHFRNGVVAEDPEFSNARGLWKYAKYWQD